MNEEDKKLGIKCSSTRQIFFNDCKVPVNNLLYKREWGANIFYRRRDLSYTTTQ